LPHFHSLYYRRHFIIAARIIADDIADITAAIRALNHDVKPTLFSPHCRVKMMAQAAICCKI
jgi:hypothetical protein